MSDTKPDVPQTTSDSKTIATLLWVGTLLFGFIPPLIVFLIKKDDPLLLDQSKEALNWSITALIGYAIGFVLTFIIIGVFVILALWIVHIVFCIMGAIKNSNGEAAFRVPFALRLVK